MKRYILYAGVNGAGKSMLYRTTHYKDSMPRINTDEIIILASAEDIKKVGNMYDVVNDYFDKHQNYCYPN